MKKPFPELRQKAAERIRANRKIERSEDSYTTERNAQNYDHMFSGYTEFFNYVMSHPTLPKRVLEVGVGEGHGFRGIQKQYRGKVELIGTALRLPNYEVNRKGIRLTSAEVLTGIKAESLGGIYGVYSFAYGQPDLVVERFDQVLAPGGVIKAIVGLYDTGRLYDSTPFVKLWEKKGYDMFVTKDVTQGFDLIIAVKPDKNNKSISSKDLYEKDLEAREKRIAAS